ncbi:hypothetical protein BT69DRAFT_1327968 [Atractiella rhizophila]|nr:hypothetical protein BT69DRAFT_1327968 [Atractiella rhizophila]
MKKKVMERIDHHAEQKWSKLKELLVKSMDPNAAGGLKNIVALTVEIVKGYPDMAFLGLNAARESTPFPASSLNQMAGNKFYFCVDMCRGFYAIFMLEEDIEKMAFYDPG